MGRIDNLTEDRIKSAARIVDVVGDFVALRKSGKDLAGLCPFHDDRHVGSFIVSQTKNIATCFACGWHGDPVKFVMDKEGLKYGEALRWLAGKYGIFVDDEPTNYKTPPTPAAIQPALPELPVITFPTEMVSAKLANDCNPLVSWMRSLDWSHDERKVLEMVLKLYAVGTSDKGATKGWTIWWFIDDENKVRTGKMMKYGPDGHRWKGEEPAGEPAGTVARSYNTDWIHAKLRKAGYWSDETHRVEKCLFGLHLVDCFADAEVCIVESEKSAIMAQTISRPTEKLFMATGSKGSMTRRMLQPIIDRHRWIVLYPDVDGMDEWTAIAKSIDYDRIMVTDRVQKLYDPAKDSPKSDIADIIARMKTPVTTYERVEQITGEHNEARDYMIRTLNLTLR